MSGNKDFESHFNRLMKTRGSDVTFDRFETATIENDGNKLHLDIIAAKGGLVGAWPAGIGIDSLSGFVDRTLELVKAVGIDHVCLGTDMDANYKPVFDNYRKLPLFVGGLAKQGLSEGDIAKIIGGNFIRVFRDNSPQTGA